MLSGRRLAGERRLDSAWKDEGLEGMGLHFSTIQGGKEKCLHAKNGVAPSEHSW